MYIVSFVFLVTMLGIAASYYLSYRIEADLSIIIIYAQS